jgi:hypothetical protein
MPLEILLEVARVAPQVADPSHTIDALDRLRTGPFGAHGPELAEVAEARRILDLGADLAARVRASVVPGSHNPFLESCGHSIFSGEADPSDALAMARTASEMCDPDRNVAKIASHVQREARNAAIAELIKCGDRILVEYLRPSVKVLVQALTRHAEMFDANANSADAARWPRESRHEWEIATDLAIEFAEVAAICDSMRLDGILPVSRDRYGYQYVVADPSVLPRFPPHRDLTAWVLDVIRSGAGLSIYTDDELVLAERAAQPAELASAK